MLCDRQSLIKLFAIKMLHAAPRQDENIILGHGLLWISAFVFLLRLPFKSIRVIISPLVHALDYHRDIHDESFGRGLSSQFVRDSRAENVFWVERTFVWEKRYCLIYLAIVNGEASSIESPQ